MIRNTLGSEGGCFKCVKITLIMFHIFALMGATLILFGIISMAMDNKSYETKDEKEQEQIKMMKIFAICLFSFAIIYEMIAIIGVIKENKTIVITYLVLSVIGFVGNTVYGYQTGVLTLIVICLTAYYGYMIVKKDREVV